MLIYPHGKLYVTDVYLKLETHGEDVVSRGKMSASIIGQTRVKATYASVKKPTPATRTTFTWNHLKFNA